MPYSPAVSAPNHTIQAIFDRKSCRSFNPSHPLSKETIDVLAECAKASPSACNYQNINVFVLNGIDKTTEFGLSVEPYVLEEKPFMRGIAASKDKMGLKSFIFYDAPVAFVMTGNARDESKIRTLSADSGHCSQSIMIGAKSLGYDSICVGCMSGPKASEAALKYLKEHCPDFPWEDKGKQKLLLSVGVGIPKIEKGKPFKKDNIYHIK
ncbi:hypothetical protein ADUPG1_011272 [Aduncisulcus paluster]|uniref:Nitroreductase domain-containing protein n=1 Tax=Aduncisulcus paluster TaxID=2918883 RepID=A0ABQ5JV06_9EUKA|nr:hypothetical protein ADUPG1_011272 [Aduncisulcus paluster]